MRPPGFQHRPVHTVASYYTDCDIAVQVKSVAELNLLNLGKGFIQNLLSYQHTEQILHSNTKHVHVNSELHWRGSDFCGTESTEGW